MSGWTNSSIGSAVYLIPPTVSSVSPAANATAVSVTSTITATFSTDMDPSTITTSTFQVKIGSTPVAGSVSYAARVATFTPTGNLSKSTTYTASLSTAVKDTYGAALVSASSWSFSTVLDAIYVGTAGSDSNPGTKNMPRLTLQSSINLASSGTEVRVSQGTYAVSSTITMKDGVALVGGYSADFSTRSIGVYTTTINDTRNMSGQVDTIDILSLSSSTRVDGFTINGPYVTGGANMNAVIVYITSSSPTIQNNKLFSRHGGNSCVAVQINGTTSAPLIRNNVLTAEASNYTITVYINGASPFLQNNTIYAENGAIISYGVRIYAGSHPYIDNNIILTGGTGPSHMGIAETGTGTSTDADPIELKNNCISSCPQGLYFDQNLSLTCTQVNATGNFGNGTTWMSTPTGTGNIVDAPVFTSQSTGDYTLLITSPVNVRGGACNLSSQYTTDGLGVTRTTTTPIGMTNSGASGWSVGAFERD